MAQIFSLQKVDFALKGLYHLGSVTSQRSETLKNPETHWSQELRGLDPEVSKQNVGLIKQDLVQPSRLRHFQRQRC